MCNRVHRASKVRLKEVFGDMIVTESERFDEGMAFGYDKPLMPVLVDFPHTDFEEMQWGYLPAAANGNPELQSRFGILLNARAESLFDKFAFKKSILQRRCILMLDGFYEYQHKTAGSKSSKQMYFVSLKNGLFPAAAVWDECDGQKTFAIITTAANPLMAEIHNLKERQPHAILQNDWDRWLHAKSETEIKELLKVFPDDNMQAEPVESPAPPKPKRRGKPGLPELPGLFG